MTNKELLEKIKDLENKGYELDNILEIIKNELRFSK